MSLKHILIDARESGTSTGRYIDKLIEYMHAKNPGYKITVLTHSARLGYIRSIAPKFEVAPTRYKEFSFGEQIGLLRQINKLSPDLVHFGMTQQPILYRGKVVTTMHDLTTTRFVDPDKNRLIFLVKQVVYKLVTKIVAKKSQAIITPSEYVKDDVARYARVNSRKITVTYEAADKIEDSPKPIEDLVGKEFIMYVGRSFPHKNLKRLVDAMHLLQQEFPGLRLVLAGKKDRGYKKLERYAHDTGAKRVVFTGFVTEAELRWLYENTLTYVFPSLSEGFGLPGLEAMVHGAPVVSSSATCLPEIYKDGAVYFDPENKQDIADVIKLIVADPKHRQKLNENGKKVSSAYSWKKTAEDTLAVYDSVLS